MSEEIVINETISTEIIEESSGLLGLSYPVWSIIAAIIFMIIAVKLSKSKRKQKNIIALVGQRFAGKTQLFIRINEGKKMATVPSIHNNHTTYKMGNKQYQMIDYIGDNISKEEVLQRIDQIHTIIHVIDGTQTKTISDSAMFLYKVLVSKDYQKNNCNYIIFVNKNDVSGFIGLTKLQQKLQDQIQHIKQSRINQGEQFQTEDDYIKLSKNRFKIPFKIIEGSAQSNIKDLQMTLQNM